MSRENVDYTVSTEEGTGNIERLHKAKEDLRLLHSIRQITSRGNDAEVRRKKEGKLLVYEVKKNKVPVE